MLDKLKNVTGKTKKYMDFNSKNFQHSLETIRNDLKNSKAELVIDAMLKEEARQEIKKIVRNNYAAHFMDFDEDKLDEVYEYVVSEIVGTGVIERLINERPDITDISHNGSHLIVESSDYKDIYKDTDHQITEQYITRLIQKFAHAVGKEFTPKNPIFDGVYGSIRINSVHKQNTTGNSTMSLRIVRPTLALNEENFHMFAPTFMLDFFKVIMESRNNILISGETGTGKTELLKLLFSYILFEHKAIMIEDVPETHVKELFPDKDVLSWITGNGVTVTDLIKAALRNNPRWINVSELRGKEAYEMVQAVLSGHHIMTTLHSVDAETSPKRLVNMSKIGYQVDEKSLEEDIKRYFDFGFHIKRVVVKTTNSNKVKINRVLRYLSKVVQYSSEGCRMVFEQKYQNGKFIYSTGSLSGEFYERLAEADLSYKLPKFTDEVDLKNGLVISR
ncbi:CpaF/VirB11 family protein [Bacillus thuringiensis]|uniref:CpaF/VirB11 family protein n=1 Tax=Bacillus thuringiensis TaxID=1428 RepID=UPI002DBD8521|nr:CpaF/VirB11 family protein [Bacillus thuringiensis]MEC3226210.1 CpaF/VirB11 family protein [Bacillus thuringiensis]MEC3463560.1 CpaF/VirB11 family protein [Bacillus thuringiensis]MEC3556647.1 CpaF/VirB11 family protein [Bacillus thuringiensis]MED2060319.1 CpaF/VirB11 family protein [Bacillus thuringiensis]